MSAAIFEIPKSNVLRFVDTTNYLSDKQTFDNRLIYDEKWGQDDEIKIYYQKFYTGDKILTQFTTNWPSANISFKMYDRDNNEVATDLTLQIAYTYLDDSGNVTYNVICDTTSIALGVYYFQITTSTPTKEFTSEPIEIGLFADYPLVEWRLSDNDGIYYTDSTIFGFRVEAQLIEKEASENDVYEGFNFQPEIERSISQRLIELQLAPIPRYIKEKLKLACDHFEVFINGMQCVKKNEAKTDPIPGSNFWDFSISLQQIDYEDYTIIQELTGITLNYGQLIDGNDMSVLYDGYDLTILTGSR